MHERPTQQRQHERREQREQGDGRLQGQGCAQGEYISTRGVQCKLLPVLSNRPLHVLPIHPDRPLHVLPAEMEHILKPLPPEGKDPRFHALSIGVRYSEHRAFSSHLVSWTFDDKHPLQPMQYPYVDSTLTQLRSENSTRALAGLGLPAMLDHYLPTLQVPDPRMHGDGIYHGAPWRHVTLCISRPR